MKKAFKKPNLNLLKAIKHIQSKGATLERYCLSAEAYSFALDPGRGIVLGKSFHIETKNVFQKNFILVHNNQFTLYLR